MCISLPVKVSLVSFFSISLQFLFKPYTNRLKLGEGGLLFLNVFHSCVYYKDIFLILLNISISLFAICLLYGYNDFVDRAKDIHNPKKNQDFVHLINTYPKLFLWINGSLSVAILLLAYHFFGVLELSVLVGLFLINFFYSNLFKGIPLLDVIIVGMWGAVYVIIPTINWYLFFAAGIMTAIAHVYQVITDKETDKISKTNTSAVAVPGMSRFVIIILSILLSLVFFSLGEIIFAATAVFLIIVKLIRISVSSKWYFSRVYFGACWIYLLYLTYYEG